MKCKDWPIGICSWSLQTDVAGVADAMEKIGIEHVHLAVRADDHRRITPAFRTHQIEHILCSCVDQFCKSIHYILVFISNSRNHL